MAEWVQSGRLVELILLGVVVEAAVLAALGRAGLLPHLAAGAFLLLALRSALVTEPWWAVAAWLALAGVSHAADLSLAWRRP